MESETSSFHHSHDIPRLRLVLERLISSPMLHLIPLYIPQLISVLPPSNHDHLPGIIGLDVCIFEISGRLNC